MKNFGFSAVLVIAVAAVAVIVFVEQSKPVRQINPALGSQTRVRVLVQSLQLYAQDHSEKYPSIETWVQDLSQAGYITIEDSFAPIFNGVSVPYSFVPGPVDENPQRIMVYGDPDPGQEGVMTGFANGDVERLPHNEFERRLAEQLGEE